uniref:(northern house mosquito) hypothetical protein n=1 Tax=Culex pipiens TaxID=7175 RepID=A0A8D7ZYC6_CULPI
MAPKPNSEPGNDRAVHERVQIPGQSAPRQLRPGQVLSAVERVPQAVRQADPRVAPVQPGAADLSQVVAPGERAQELHHEQCVAGVVGRLPEGLGERGVDGGFVPEAHELHQADTVSVLVEQA